MKIFINGAGSLCLLSIVLSDSFDTTSGQDEADTTFPPVGKEWIAPNYENGDVRSPCPFINTLANHGFIDRTGTNVDIFEMVNQLSVNFDVADGLFLKLANGAIDLDFTTQDEDGIERLSINNLFTHNKQEHDASFVRADEYFGSKASEFVDLELLSGLLATNPDSEVLTKEDIMSYQQSRILHSRANNPEHMFKLAQSTSFSAQATLLLVFGQNPELKSVDKKQLEELFKFERFPEGYKPTTVQTDVILDGSLANDIRLEFVKSFEDTIAKELEDADSADGDGDTAADSAAGMTFDNASLGWGSLMVTLAFFLTFN